MKEMKKEKDSAPNVLFTWLWNSKEVGWGGFEVLQREKGTNLASSERLSRKKPTSSVTKRRLKPAQTVFLN